MKVQGFNETATELCGSTLLITHFTFSYSLFIIDFFIELHLFCETKKPFNGVRLDLMQTDSASWHNVLFTISFLEENIPSRVCNTVMLVIDS